MPRYHFNIIDGGRKPDRDGSELVGLAGYRIEAVRLFGEILSDKPDEFWSDQDMRVEVTDHTGAVLFVMQMMALESPAVTDSDPH